MIFSLLLLLAAPPGDLHKRAIDTFNRADFARAADLLRLDLQQQIGKPEEEKTRELLVLALFNAGKEDDAVAAYRVLLERFPKWRFDEDSVLPDTIAFFEKHAPRKAVPPTPAPVASAPVVIAKPASAASAPVVLKQPATPPPEAKRFRWYYLFPLGIGQYAAGSPVRGTIFLLLQAGFLVMNLVGYYAIYQPQQLPDDSSKDADRARMGMLLTNIGFGGLLGAIAAGIVDAAAFERN